MFGNSHAQSRQLASIFCLLCIAMLTLVIVSTVSINGKLNNQGRCNLYFRPALSPSLHPSYSNGYCIMPVVTATLLGAASVIFVSYQIMVVRRHEEFHPRRWSIILLAFSFLAALVSFVICIEIAAGIKVACEPEGLEMMPGRGGGPGVPGGGGRGGPEGGPGGAGEQQGLDCRSYLPFGALYVAQICAGVMGGLWMVVAILEWFQYKAQPLHGSVRPLSRQQGTTVLPYMTEVPTTTTTTDHWRHDNHDANLNPMYLPSVRPAMTTVDDPPSSSSSPSHHRHHDYMASGRI